MQKTRIALPLVSFGLLLYVAGYSAVCQELGSRRDGSSVSGDPEPSKAALKDAVAGIKSGEHALYLYERVERLETRKEAGDAAPQSVRVARVVPSGTGMTKLGLGLDGKPPDADAYRAELNQLLNALTWAAASGQPQREAYQKVQKKQKDRDELIDATKNAFLFTYLTSEPRGDRMLAKYRMEPNPAYHASNRATSIFSRVKGFVWIDESSHELARVEGEVTEDISVGLFLAKVYKGSRFMQERYETAPGLWLPSFTQYDFDGRKFFSSFAIHERTFYSGYKRIGTPAEAIPQIQAEIAELGSRKSAENR